MNTPLDIVTAKALTVIQTAQALLSKESLNTILSCGRTTDELVAAFKSIDCIFTDADGTVVEEGQTSFPREYSVYIEQLAQVGITTTLVTGKPYAEITPLVASLPPNSPLHIIYEKGAYYLQNDGGTLTKHYLLSTPELEASVHDLRELFLKHKATIENKYRDSGGKQLVTLGWSGSGTHESILAIDILAGIPPAHYLQIIGSAREDLKVKDPALLKSVESDLQAFVDTNRPRWRLTHLGNGNSEIAPGPIEKDIAITQTDTFKKSRGVLLWGDSGNDRQMFALRRLPHVLAGLVLHREASADLVNDVDFVSFGMANAKPFFELLLGQHSRGE